jgi:hypothetical protein
MNDDDARRIERIERRPARTARDLPDVTTLERIRELMEAFPGRRVHVCTHLEGAYRVFNVRDLESDETIHTERREQ